MFEVVQPDLTQEIVDPKEFAVFEEFDFFDTEDLEDAGIEMQPLDKMGSTVTLSDPSLGFTGTAVQNILANFEVVDDLDDPDNINFLFQADIPRDAIYESAIIYQWAQLTPKTHASVGDVSVDCKVQVGNPDGAYAGVYKSKIEDSQRSGKEWWNFSGSDYHDVVYADTIWDDWEFYELKKSDTSF